MVPFQVENTGWAVTVALEGELPGRSADAGGEIVEDRRRPGRDVPAGGGGAGLGGAGLTQDETHDAALIGAQRQPPAGRKVEWARMAPDLGKHGGQGATAKGLLENPEGLRRPSGLHDDQLGRIEAKAVEPGSIRTTRLVEGVGFADQQERAMVALGESGEKGHGKAGGGGRIACRVAADFMQRISAQPARERRVKGADAERQARPIGGQADGLAFDFSDSPAESGKDVPCHGNTCVHGRSNRSD